MIYRGKFICNCKAQNFIMTWCLYSLIRVKHLGVEKHVSTLQLVPMVSEYPDVFCQELVRLAPIREIKFGFDVYPDR